RKEVVGQRDVVPHRLVEMTVGVDAAGQHVATARVEIAARRAEIAPQGGDDPVADPDLGLEDIGRGSHHRVTNDRVELRHAGLLSPRLRATEPSARTALYHGR